MSKNVKYIFQKSISDNRVFVTYFVTYEVIITGVNK